MEINENSSDESNVSNDNDIQCRFILKKWNPVALWSWNVDMENCAICRNKINGYCLDCLAKPSSSDGDCIIAWGSCNHAFHFHCISRWLKTKKNCPVDNQEWQFQKYGE